MENVYIAAIAGIVIIVVVVFFLLRRRIIRAGGKISLKERALEGEVEAVPPEAVERFRAQLREALNRFRPR